MRTHALLFVPTALLLGILTGPATAQGQPSVPVAVQPPTAIDIMLFTPGGPATLVAKTDPDGKATIARGALANVGRLDVVEEICPARRRVLLIAPKSQAPEGTNCTRRSIGTFVVGKDSVLNAVLLSSAITPSVRTVKLPDQSSQAAAPQAATAASGAAPQPSTTKPGTPAMVTTGTRFRDDFDKPPLTAPWRIDGEDKDSWTIERGYLVIVSKPGKAATQTEKEEIRNRVVFDRDLPADYTVTVRVNVEIIRTGTRAGLRVRATNGGSVMVGILGYVVPFVGTHRAPFIEKLPGAQSALLFARTWDEGKPTQVAFAGLARRQETIWFRLGKKGSQITGEFSMDGDRFERIGQQFLIGTDGSRLELIAYDETPGAETGVEFDFVEITP